jgi:tetratricopeptide (TPR) repeat protein
MVRFLAKLSAILAVLGLIVGGGYLYVMHHWHAAQAAVKEYRLEDAGKSLRVCLFVWPRSIPVHVLAARAARLDGKFDEADKHLKECLRLANGSTPEVQVEYLLMRVQRGEEDEVAGELIGYVQSDTYSDSALIMETLALAYMRNLRYGAAFTCLSRWMQIEPNAAEPCRRRGWVLEHLNDWGGAMKDYECALDLDPGLVDVRLRLAELQLIHANLEDAIPHLERLAREHPDRADVKARLGQLRFLQGRMEEARPLLEAAVKEMPDDAPVLIHLAKLEMDANHPEKAEPWLRHALEVDSTDTEVEFNLVACLQQAGRESEARVLQEKREKDAARQQKVNRLIQKEAENPRGDPEALYEIGALFLETGDARVGLYWLHRALQRSPEHQATHKLLAEFYEKKGEKEKAAEHRRHLQPAK